jgi:hypothetical protein
MGPAMKRPDRGGSLPNDVGYVFERKITKNLNEDHGLLVTGKGAEDVPHPLRGRLTFGLPPKAPVSLTTPG